MLQLSFGTAHVVAFTGHRPNKFLDAHHGVAFKGGVKAHLREALHLLRPTLCISGMALGVDTWAAEVCVEDRIPFIAAVPFVGQDALWLSGDRDIYQGLLAQAAKVVVVSKGGYSAHKMFKRNEWMVDNARTLLAVWDGSQGGTGSCVNYALKQAKLRADLSILRLDPDLNFQREWLAKAA